MKEKKTGSFRLRNFNVPSSGVGKPGNEASRFLCVALCKLTLMVAATWNSLELRHPLHHGFAHQRQFRLTVWSVCVQCVCAVCVCEFVQCVCVCVQCVCAVCVCVCVQYVCECVQCVCVCVCVCVSVCVQ